MTQPSPASPEQPPFGFRLRHALHGHEEIITQIAWSPDKRLLASASMDRTVRIWDAETGESVKTLEGQKPVFGIAWSPNGRTLAVASGDDPVRLWDVETGQISTTIETPVMNYPRLRQTLEDRFIGRELRALCLDLRLDYESLTRKGEGKPATVRALLTYFEQRDDITRLLDALRRHRPDIDWDEIIKTPREKTDRIPVRKTPQPEFSIKLGQLIQLLTGNLGPDDLHMLCFELGVDDDDLPGQEADKVIELVDHLERRDRIFDLLNVGKRLQPNLEWDSVIEMEGSGVEPSRLPEQTDSTLLYPVYSVAWSPDGRTLVLGYSDDTFRIWDAGTRKLDRYIDRRRAWGDAPFEIPSGMADLKNRGLVNCVLWSPSGAAFALVSGGDSVYLSSGDQEERSSLRHTTLVLGAAWSPDGRLLATSCFDGTVQLWDAEARRQIVVLEGHADVVTSVSFSPDGRLLASKSLDDTVRIWRCDTWTTVSILNESTSGIWPSSLTFHPKDPMLATLGEKDMTIHIWDLDIAAVLSAASVTPSAYYTSSCPKTGIQASASVSER